MSTSIIKKELKLPPISQAFFDEVMKKHTPEAKIKIKSDSWVNKFFSVLVRPFNPDFLNGYITTIGTTVYFPDNFLETYSDENILEVLVHENIHIMDRKKYGLFLWILIYGFPQILATLSLLALGAIFYLPMLWCLLFLLFLLPFPAPGRYHGEITAYKTSILLARKMRNATDFELTNERNMIITQLSKSFYYFTWPFPKMIERDLLDQTFMIEPRYSEITDFLKIHGLMAQMPISK